MVMSDSWSSAIQSGVWGEPLQNLSIFIPLSNCYSVSLKATEPIYSESKRNDFTDNVGLQIQKAFM